MLIHIASNGIRPSTPLITPHVADLESKKCDDPHQKSNRIRGTIGYVAYFCASLPGTAYLCRDLIPELREEAIHP